MRAIGADRIGSELEHPPQELRVVHSAGVDAQSSVPEHPDQMLGEQEVLDRDPVHSVPESPGSERFGRVAAQITRRDGIPFAEAVGPAMEADHLDSVADRLPPEPPAERLCGAAGEAGSACALTSSWRPTASGTRSFFAAI
jgi:hypothetical protein